MRTIDWRAMILLGGAWSLALSVWGFLAYAIAANL